MNMPAKYLLYFFCIFLFYSCVDKKKIQNEIVETKGLKTGIWRGEILLNNKSLPFNFEIRRNKEDETVKELIVINDQEHLVSDTLQETQDSILWVLNKFHTYVKAKITEEGQKLKGICLIENKPFPFEAIYGEKRRFLMEIIKPNDDISGTWAVFFKNNKGESWQAVGIFAQDRHQLVGNIKTREGAFRFLEGIVSGQKLRLSCFEGDHAYLLEADIQNENHIINGEFWSVSGEYRRFEAIRSENAEMID
ncbi:MAG: hypothetical protein OHK0038_12440 [Flammeovirgaceae bacterium]